MRGGTFKEFPIYCPTCEYHEVKLAWNYDFPLACSNCGEETVLDYPIKFGDAPGITTDDIPGGIEIKHGKGLINDDGTPKRYYSKTDLYRACNEHGWKVSGDTPGVPYRVSWSGRRKSDAGLPLKNAGE